MNSKLRFSEENIHKLFGHEAAEDESFERLQSYYIKNKTHDKVMADLPIRILVGHKGIGKSALFKIAISEDEARGNLPILIKPDDIADLAHNSANFHHLIRDWKQGLIEIIASKVLLSFGQNEEKFISRLSSFGGHLINFLIETANTTLSDRIDINPSRAKIINSFLASKKVVVYLDDLDRGWQSRREDITRISALLNAVRDLSNDNPGLYFRISLRSDVYFLVRTSDESTDKIEGYIVWHNWTNHEILLLLIKRIESFLGRDCNIESLKNIEQRQLAHYLDSVFEKRFNGHGKWSNAPMYKILMSLIRKRPRDLVKLCTLAARQANERGCDLITTDCFTSVFEEYSHGRIQDTVNEFKSELPHIERLLLNMKASQKEQKEGLGYIYDTGRIKQKIRNITTQGQLVFQNGRLASEIELLQFMYKINFLTARKRLESGEIHRKYFEENRLLTSQVANFGYDWEIHPAFRWALQPDSLSDLFSQLDLSADY